MSRKQNGYIKIVLVVFALLIGIMIFPVKFPASSDSVSSGAFCIDPPAGAPTVAGPSYVTDSTYATDGDGNRGGFDDSVLTGAPTNYKMIKANVPIIDISDDWFHFKAEPLVEVETPFGKRVFLWPTAISGIYQVELPDESKTPDIIFHDYGIVFLQHVNADGSVRTVTSGETEIPVTDVYKDVNKPEIPYDNLFACKELDLDEQYNSGYNSVVFPSQSTSPDKKELQMEWFLLGKSPFKAATMYSGCKPAVYLYPPSKQLVNVRVFPEGYLTYVDPPYDPEKGWTVTAYPDGSLVMPNAKFQISNAQYEYLYYESKIRDEVIDKPSKGWVVRGTGTTGTKSTTSTTREEMNSLFERILPVLGLNEIQKKDFIEYWNKALPEAPYYFVGLVDQANVDAFERLEITPEPDYVNRVRVYFEMLKEPKVVEAPVLTRNQKPVTSNQFSVVEWGGMVKTDPSHPFTCSQ